MQCTSGQPRAGSAVTHNGLCCGVRRRDWPWWKLALMPSNLAQTPAGLSGLKGPHHFSGSGPNSWDGQPHYLTGLFGPPFLRPQSKHKDPTKQELIRAIKVVKVRKLYYIKAGKIVSGTSFFSMDKGATDIQRVYNGTRCGTPPHFGLPTMRETLQAIMPGFYQCDLDVEDQFLNIKLHKSLREYLGVDIHEVRSLARKDASWEALSQQDGNSGRETGWA
jgi:hypothetical protein